MIKEWLTACSSSEAVVSPVSKLWVLAYRFLLKRFNILEAWTVLDLEYRDLTDGSGENPAGTKYVWR